ncbi:MAG: hypothetical protein II453_00705 [Alphaproteobacteria bacterium]|nr:hypothetical protein [Alphaproteobacteria bacterium]
MKINPVEMMHSLSNYSYEVIKTIADEEGISVPRHTSKVELIAVIIAERAEREGRDSVYKMVRENNNDREKYCLHTEDRRHYLRLTPEQATMLEWCLENEINFYGAELESIGEVNWETP